MTAAHVLRTTLRGAVRRCPHCGRGRLFDGFYELYAACPRCGDAFSLGEGEYTGALMFAIGGFGTLFGAGLVVLFLLRRPALWMYAWIVVSLILGPLLVYPNIKGAWFGFLRGMRGED